MVIDQVAIPKNGDYEYLDIGANSINVFFNKTGSRLSSTNTEAALKELASGYAPILRGTTEYWNSQPSLVSELNCIYVYEDKAQVDGVWVPAIKIGDGLAYLIDLPFVGDEVRAALISHMSNSTIHITAAERASWNNKITCENEVSGENLFLTRN